jgi:hypothetical protein
MMIWVIVGVLVLTGVLIVALWSVVKSTERAERDPWYRRRLFLIMAGMYVVGSVFAISDVLSGHAPLVSLAGLPVVVLLVWFWLRMARRVRIPPHGK